MGLASLLYAIVILALLFAVAVAGEARQSKLLPALMLFLLCTGCCGCADMAAANPVEWTAILSAEGAYASLNEPTPAPTQQVMSLLDDRVGVLTVPFEVSVCPEGCECGPDCACEPCEGHCSISNELAAVGPTPQVAAPTPKLGDVVNGYRLHKPIVRYSGFTPVREWRWVKTSLPAPVDAKPPAMSSCASGACSGGACGSCGSSRGMLRFRR